MIKINTIFCLILLFLFPVSSYGQSVSLDHVDGLHSPTEVIADGSTMIVFNIRLINGFEYWSSIKNGFRIYSDDGANWNGLSADTVGIGMDEFNGNFSITPFSVDGSGADTISFEGFNIFGVGMFLNYNDIAYTITIGPIEPINHNKTICIDSSFYPPSGVWKWSGSTDVFPSWDGPHCFTCVDPQATAVEERSMAIIPDNFYLHQNYPNPFNPNTSIKLNIPSKTHVSLSVYNLLGQKIATLLDKEMSAGIHKIEWNGKNSSGVEVASGVYMYQMKTNDFVDTKTMLLLK